MGRKENLPQNNTLDQKLSHSAPKEIFKSPQVISKENEADMLDRYGYKKTHRKELKSRLQSIIKNGSEKVVDDTLNRYKNDNTDKDGQLLVASIVAQGYKPHLDRWIKEPLKHSLNGDTRTSIARLALALDFANQMEKAGKDKEEIRQTFGQRQPKLASLSLWTALQRVAPQHLGLVHEVADSLAQGEITVVTKRDEKIAKKFEERYTLKEEDRGH